MFMPQQIRRDLFRTGILIHLFDGHQLWRLVRPSMPEFRSYSSTSASLIEMEVATQAECGYRSHMSKVVMVEYSCNWIGAGGFIQVSLAVSGE